MARLLVGLGNPGPAYAATRHNAGFWVLDQVADRTGIACRRAQDEALVGRGTWRGQPLVLAKPLTFMNESGRSVARLVRRYGIRREEELLVILDDLALPTGALRLRPKGSSGGHRGLESVVAVLGSGDFARLRVGIGAAPPGEASSYVLQAPPPGERELLREAARRGAEVALCWALEGVGVAMNKCNSRVR